MITYRKTRHGEWVAYGPASEVRPGQVTVQTKGGKRKLETVTSVGRPFRVDGKEMVYGYLGKSPASPSQGRSRPDYYDTPDCGHRNPVPGCTLCQLGIGY